MYSSTTAVCEQDTCDTCCCCWSHSPYLFALRENEQTKTTSFIFLTQSAHTRRTASDQRPCFDYQQQQHYRCHQVPGIPQRWVIVVSYRSTKHKTNSPRCRSSASTLCSCCTFPPLRWLPAGHWHCCRRPSSRHTCAGTRSLAPKTLLHLPPFSRLEYARHTHSSYRCSTLREVQRRRRSTYQVHSSSSSSFEHLHSANSSRRSYPRLVAVLLPNSFGTSSTSSLSLFREFSPASSSKCLLRYFFFTTVNSRLVLWTATEP